MINLLLFIVFHFQYHSLQLSVELLDSKQLNLFYLTSQLLLMQIIQAFEGNLPLDDLTEGIQPRHDILYDSHESTDYDALYDTTQYREDLIKFRKMALEGVEHTTSECSVVTSEFGRRPSGSSSEGLRNTEEK